MFDAATRMCELLPQTLNPDDNSGTGRFGTQPKNSSIHYEIVKLHSACTKAAVLTGFFYTTLIHNASFMRKCIDLCQISFARRSMSIIAVAPRMSL